MHGTVPIPKNAHYLQSVAIAYPTTEKISDSKMKIFHRTFHMCYNLCVENIGADHETKSLCYSTYRKI